MKYNFGPNEITEICYLITNSNVLFLELRYEYNWTLHRESNQKLLVHLYFDDFVFVD